MIVDPLTIFIVALIGVAIYLYVFRSATKHAVAGAQIGIGELHQSMKESAATMDALTPIPSSILDDKMKDALREISRLGEGLTSRFSKAGFEPIHPFVVNLALLRLYINHKKCSTPIDSVEHDSHPQHDNYDNTVALDDRFISQAIYFLRFADAMYEVTPIIAEKDVLLNVKEETSASNINIPRHMVFLDHVSKSIVVAIRGTASLSDIMTDLYIDTKLFLGKYQAHRGIALSAEGMLESIIEAIETGRRKRSGVYSDYDIVVVGHSLGAGTASCLGLLLSKKDYFITVYAYGSPPIVSDVMKECHSYHQYPHVKDPAQKCKIHNFVNHEDIVTRSSKHEMANMMTQLAMLDRLPWNAAKRTRIILGGGLEDSDVVEIEDAVKTRQEFDSEDDVALFVPGTVYVLKPVETVVHAAALPPPEPTNGEPGSGFNKKLAGLTNSFQKVTTKAPPSPLVKPSYNMYRLKDASSLYNGVFYTGDNMLSDHRTGSYLHSLIHLGEDHY